MSAAATALAVGELSEQLRAAVQGAPQGTALVRVEHGQGHTLVKCELWVVVAGLAPALCCDLPAGVGVPMRLVERAIEGAGFGFPHADLGPRGRWQPTAPYHHPNVDSGFELAIVVPELAAGALSPR